MTVTKQQMEDQIKAAQDNAHPDSLRYTTVQELIKLIALTVPYIESMVEKLERRNESK